MTKKPSKKPAPAAPKVPLLEPIVEPGPDKRAAPSRDPERKSTALAKRAKPVPLAKPLDELVNDARAFVDASASENTRRAYAADWRTFSTWCAEHNLVALPAEVSTLVLYITHLAKQGRKVTTIERAKTAIGVAHETAKVKDNPTHATEVKRVMKGIRRTLSVARTKKTPIRRAALKAMIEKANDGSLRGLRDAALLAIGFAGAFRRSELVAIKVEHLDHQPEGLIITIPKSKTNQEGEEERVAIKHKGTIDLLYAWLNAAGIEEGFVFRPVMRDAVAMTKGLTAEFAADIVKKYAEACGFDPKLFAGHSLRRGFATQAIRDGKPAKDVMKQTRHKSHRVFEGYVEEGSIFQNNATEDLW